MHNGTTFEFTATREIHSKFKYCNMHTACEAVRKPYLQSVTLL